ncbi:MAG: hypothetical protein ACF8PN_13990 [Phycisphaerales bacterium]
MALSIRRRVRLLGAIGALIAPLAFASTSVATVEPRIGLHGVGGSFLKAARTYATQIRRIVDWIEVEPEPGVYDFEGADEVLRAASQYNLDITITLRCNSNRYTRIEIPEYPQNKYAAYPTDMDQWLAYLEAVIERYDGDGYNDMPGLTRPVKYWQIENEFLHMWLDTEESLHDFVRLSAAHIRLADPEAKIISPAFTNLNKFALADGIDPRDEIVVGTPLSPKKLTKEKAVRSKYNPDGNYQMAVRLIEEVAEHCDIIDLHMYPTTLDDIRYWTGWAQATMDKAGVVRPLWSLELGLPYFHFTHLLHNQLMAPSLATGFECGLERIYVSHLAESLNPNMEHLVLLEPGTRKETSAYYNFTRATCHIDGFVAVTAHQNGDQRAWVFEKSNGDLVTILHSESPSVETVYLPAQGVVSIYDMMGPTASVAPVGRRVRAQGGRIPVMVGPDPIVVVMPNDAHSDRIFVRGGERRSPIE